MTAAPRHPRQAKERRGRQSRTAPTPQRKAGRPKGPPSTIVNLRIPLDLLAQLDRYIDRLEVQTGLKANRGMIARRALELFLETHATGKRKRSLERTKRAASE
jgi:hypothetical protein